MARLQASPHSPWILKGGHAMELRFAEARSTVDLDLMAPPSAFGSGSDLSERAIQGRLLEALKQDLGDFFEFDLVKSGRALQGPKYAGYRFPVIASVDRKPFERFHVDVGIGDPLIGPPCIVSGDNMLAFAGIVSPALRAISAEQQFAEKIHAYTMPRGDYENTRVKDLVDLHLLQVRGTLDPHVLHRALRSIFSLRASHPLPTRLESPPPSWLLVFESLAKQCNLQSEMESVFQQLASYYEQITHRPIA